MVERAIILASECRERKALAALHTWDEDRRARAAELGSKLPHNPEWVLCQLRKTPHGCDWLLDRWNGLLDCLQRGDGWTAAERILGLDLLATPAEFRDGRTRVNGATADETRTLRLEIAELERHKRAGIDELDAFDRMLAL